MPRISKLISICLHAIAITIALTPSVLSPEPLPSIRSLLAFHDVTPAKIADVPHALPARSPSRSAQAISRDVAPLDAPDRIAPESPRAGGGIGADSGAGDVPAANGLENIPGVGVVANPEPPPSPPPSAPLRLHAGIQPPVKVFDAKPVYPTMAQAARQQGIVVLEAVIDVTGSVQSVRVLRGYPLLDQAAADAVRKWRFTPALLNKQPVPVAMTVTVNFTLQ
jgi:protein TonB